MALRGRWSAYRPFADFHTHTRHSHGRGTVLDNARAAAGRNLRAVGIADHGPGSLPWIGVASSRTFSQIRAEARRAADLTGIQVLTCAEANVMSPEGDLDLPSAVVRGLDLLLVGLHLMVRPPSLDSALRLILPNTAPWRWSRCLREASRVTNTKALVEAVHRHPVAIVTHPGLHLPVDTPELARACAARGTRLEISSAHPETDVPYVRAAAREGADFVLSSDAHVPSRVGDLEPALAVARRAELEPDRVWNVCQKPTGYGPSTRGGPAFDPAK